MMASRALAPHVGTLLRGGHNAVYTGLALEALAARSELATAELVGGVVRLLELVGDPLARRNSWCRFAPDAAGLQAWSARPMGVSRNMRGSISASLGETVGAKSMWSRTSVCTSTPGATSTSSKPPARNSKTARSVT